MRAVRKIKRRSRCGFTLIEVLVTSVLVTVAVVATMGGIRTIMATQSKAQTADLLQRLASEKLDDSRYLSSPDANGTSGDFTDRGYPDITWNMQVQAAGVTNLDQVTVTATRGSDSEELTTMMYAAPATTTGTTTAAGTAAGATGGG
ncbi:MAG TPA: prepilin-type N-terminal cleavage/methylation domain-containing protein [Capsulimonadaceae bacterium]|nr:prepilin-type N-terminal cleavage/methylation domain-containing protein [Capsulimonadaceae bacterium]